MENYQLELLTKPIKELLPAGYNPRTISREQMDGLQHSMDEFGLVAPIVWNKRTGNVVGGHQRLKILKSRGVEETVVSVVDMDETKEKLLNVALNNPAISGDYSDDLQGLLEELQWEESGLFNDLRLDELLAEEAEDAGAGEARQTLAERFIVPPLSVLDARQGYWQDRKRAWHKLGIKPEQGREHLRATAGVDPKASYARGRGSDTGGSVFDPVLCELAYRWFCPPGGSVLDPFAGEATKGIVAAHLGYKYTGIELREEQVATNQAQAEALGLEPEWLCGDSAKLGKLVKKRKFDLVWTSPPYYDLEIYSKQEKDGSAFETYERFLEWYQQIMVACAKRLKPNRFLGVKVGEVRAKGAHGYRGFVADNINILSGPAELTYYNEAVLVTPLGSVPVRAAKTFVPYRKLSKTHQNVLWFYKGDPTTIRDHFPQEIEAGDVAVSGEEA